ncbi:MAG: hypothetical protein WC459_03900 [Patescibacteria group bacterium]
MLVIRSLGCLSSSYEVLIDGRFIGQIDRKRGFILKRARVYGEFVALTLRNLEEIAEAIKRAQQAPTAKDIERAQKFIDR